MNELVQIVQQKTGLSPDMAQRVVDTIVGYLKTKLPEPMAAGLDSLLSGGEPATGGDGGGVMDKAKAMVANLGGMLGNQEG